MYYKKLPMPTNSNCFNKNFIFEDIILDYDATNYPHSLEKQDDWHANSSFQYSTTVTVIYVHYYIRTVSSNIVISFNINKAFPSAGGARFINKVSTVP